MQTDRHKHAYTNTNNICISEHWSEAKHGCDDPFSHINKHHLSWMSTGLMLRSFCCLKYQLFIKRERVFNRVPSLFIHREWQKTPKELDFFLMLLIFYIKMFLPSGLVKLVYWCLFLFSFFWERRRLQIGQGWWEDYNLPDGTLCVLVSWQSDPTEYWDETPAWVFRKKVWNFLESVYWSVTFCIGSEKRS